MRITRDTNMNKTHIIQHPGITDFTTSPGIDLYRLQLQVIRTFGKFTGASMNPARSIGPNIVTNSGDLALYIVTPVVGAVLSNFIIQSNDE